MSYESHEDDLERCRELLDLKKFEEAFALAARLLEEAPEDPQVVAVYADAALANDRAALAVRACRRFLKLGIHDPEVSEWLIRSQWDLRLTEECLRTCRSLLRREPTNYTALDYGLSALLELGDSQSGRDLLELAESTEDEHLGYQATVARMMLGEEEIAREKFERFLSEDPRQPGTYINLMRIHHLAERYDRVEALYVEARRRGMDHEDLHFNMGLALKAQDREREAAKFFIRTVRASADLPEAHLYLAQVLRAEGHPRLALAMLQRELGVDDTQPAVHAEMAWCAEDIGEFSEAVRMIRAAVERAPDWGVYRHSLAELLMKAEGGTEETESVARDAVAMDREYAAGWQVLGRLAAERGEMKEAERFLRRAVKARDATAEDEGWLGLLLMERGRENAARPLLERAVRTFPFWEPVAEALSELLGKPLPSKFEVRLARRDAKRRYRVLHVVASDESRARQAALEVRESPDATAGVVVEEVRPLGFDVDHGVGIVWDSGPSRSPHPRPPYPGPSDE